jgi:hypothetical protein
MDLIAILLLLILIAAIFGGFAWSPLLFLLVAVVLIVALFGYGGRLGAGRRY